MELNLEEKKILEDMKVGQAQHYLDDQKSFGEINKTLEFQNKALARHEELLTISGEHNSHIRKDLTIAMNDISDIKYLLKRIEPMLIAHEEYATTLKIMKRWGGVIVTVSLALAAISGAWYIIKQFIINLK